MIQLSRTRMSCAPYPFEPILTEVLDGNYRAEKFGTEYPVRTIGSGKPDYVFLRVESGEIRLQLKNGEILVRRESFLLFSFRDFVGMRLLGMEIRFWAFCFCCEKMPPFFSPDTVYTTPSFGEEEELASLFSAPQAQGDPLSGSMANHLFARLYLNYVQIVRSKEARTPYAAEIREAVRYLQTHLHEKINLAQLAKRFHLSERNFRKIFHQEMGASPKQYCQLLRMNEAKRLLGDRSHSMQEISGLLGFSSQFQFSKDFKKQFGVTPSEFRKNGISVVV